MPRCNNNNNDNNMPLACYTEKQLFFIPQVLVVRRSTASQVEPFTIARFNYDTEDGSGANISNHANEKKLN